MGPLTRLLLPPRFQDDVAPVGGVMLRYKRDVEGSEERGGSERKKARLKAGTEQIISYPGQIMNWGKYRDA